MTTPSFISATNSLTHTTGNTFSNSMPASGIQSGDLIVVIISRKHSTSQIFSQSTGPTMTVLANQWFNFGTSTNCGSISIFTRIADATENGTTQTWSSSFSDAGFCECLVSVLVYRGVDSTTPVRINATAVGGTSTTPNPPNYNPASTRDYLWGAYCTTLVNGTVSSYPTNYTIGQTSAQGTSSSYPYSIGIAHRALAASSEDPGAFTYGTSANWGAATFLIQPIASPKGNAAQVIIIA